MKRIEEMSKVKVLNIPESAINALALYGYEIDNIAESELDGIFEKTGDLISEEEQRLIRLVVAMKALGISTQELDKAYAELVEQQKKYPHTKKLVKIVMSAKPGITGYWQVTGRSEVNFDKRIKMDADYVLKRSVSYDMYILLMTPWAMIAGKGAV